MSSKPVEPRLAAESFSCPHCGALAHQSWFEVYISSTVRRELITVLGAGQIDDALLESIRDETEKKQFLNFVERLKKHSLTFEDKRSSVPCRMEMINFWLSRCYSCEGFAVWFEDRIIHPVRETTIIAHAEMPPEIRDDFDEAAAIVNRSPRGAAALLRLCIQKLMPTLGGKGKDLNEDIGSLVRKGLEVQIQQALDVVRVVGNNAVHPGQIDLKDDRGTALTLFELLNHIVEKLIATPKRIEAIFEGLPPGAREAIKKRDALDM